MKKTALVAMVFGIYGAGAGAATTTVLEGKYIPSAYVDGCDPTTEVLEAVDVKRRIEPRHCTEVEVSNPVFVVTVPYAVPTGTDFAADMTLSLTTPSGNVKTVSFKGPRLLLPDASALTEPGMYKWHVTYKNKYGKSFNTSERIFFFNKATLESVASAATIRDRVIGTTPQTGRAHPRLLPRAADGTVMSGREFRLLLESSERKLWFTDLLTTADLYLNKSEASYPVTEPATKDAVATDASSAQMRAITRLAMAGYAKEDASYTNEAIRRLIALAGWSVDPTTSTSTQNANDMANRNIYYTLAFGLDVLHEKLSPAQKKILLESLKARIKAVDFTGLDINPYDTHSLSAVLMTAEALMMVSGIEVKTEDGAVAKFEDQNPGKLLTDAWNRVVTTLGTWGGGSDGAYGNSVSYAWWSAESYARAFANYQIVAGANLTRHPAMDKFHNNFLAFSSRNPSATLMSPFGDGTEARTFYRYSAPTYYRFYALVSGKQIDEWYAQPAVAAAAGARDLLPVEHFFLRAAQAPAKYEEQMPPDNYLFENAGTVAMHSSFNDPQRSSLYFRSSRLGSLNHSHADNNAFTFVSKGRDIFVSGGWYDSFFSELHANYTRPTRFKNALTYCYEVKSDGPYTCAGMGQSEPSATATTPGVPAADTLDTPGKLVNYFAPAEGWSVVTGDATKAYSGKSGTTWQPMVNSAIRSVAYNRAAGLVVIYDWATSDDARYWQQNFQTLYEPTQFTDPKKPGERPRLKIQPQIADPTTKALVDNGAPVCLRFHGYDGKFYTQPMTSITPLAANHSPAQFHTTYTTQTKTNRHVSVMVIAENCEDTQLVPVDLSQGTKVRVGFGTTSLTFDRDTVEIVQ